MATENDKTFLKEQFQSLKEVYKGLSSSIKFLNERGLPALEESQMEIEVLLKAAQITTTPDLEKLKLKLNQFQQDLKESQKRIGATLPQKNKK